MGAKCCKGAKTPIIKAKNVPKTPNPEAIQVEIGETEKCGPWLKVADDIENWPEFPKDHQ